MRRLLSRRRCSPVLAVSVLALFMALTGVGYAATSHGLTLGRTNKASKGTVLRSKGGPTLTLTNTGGKPAARFNVLRGRPPFAVNSRITVIGLDADLLDGLDSTAFQERVSGSCAPGSAIRLINTNGTVVCVSTVSPPPPSPPPPSPPPSWNLTGNAGTTPGTNFLGTTDAQPLVIRTNNAEALRIDTNGNLGVGTTTPGARVDASASNGVAVNGTAQTAAGVSGTSASGDGVDATSTSGAGLMGRSSSGTGVAGVANGTTAEPGVTGTSSVGNGVEGTSNGGNAGVLGKSGNGAGIVGESTNGAGAAVGVVGLSSTLEGVLGTSTSSDGVQGTSSSGNGVNGFSSTGKGVNGHSDNDTGVFGSSTVADGVQGTASTGTGVHGSATSGVGVSGISNSGDGLIGNSISANGVGGVSDSAAGVIGRSAVDGVVGISTHAALGGTAAAVQAINQSTGDIFIGVGTGARRARIDGNGKGFFDGGTQNSGADYAESIRASGDAKSLAPGDVLAIDPQHGNQVRLSDGPDSQLVAGVYSTKPAVLAVGNHGVDARLAGNVPVAMLGVVPTKVSAENGAVKPGDPLTTARTPGYAMKASSVVVGGVAVYPTGAILGKALEPLRSGSGTIEVLVTLR